MKTEKGYFEKGKVSTNFSLLSPNGQAADMSGNAGIVGNQFLALDPAAAHDLQLDDLIAAFTPDRAHQRAIHDVFSQLPRDPQVISYRQAVLDDLLANPELVERFTKLLPVIDSLFEFPFRPRPEMSWLHEVVWRAGELQNIIECFEGMGEALDAVEGRLRSQGLRSLHEEIRRAQSDPTYQGLVRELPELLAKLRSKPSLTIGVNLDPSLRPIQATLLSVNEKPFTGQSLLNQLFGVQGAREGIAPLHSVSQQSSALGGPMDPLMVPLFADLAKVMEKTAIPIADRLSQYANFHGKLFAELRPALIFYLGAVRFLRRFQTMDLPMCRPQIAPAEERRCEVKDSYNLHLALKRSGTEEGVGSAIVRNDILLGSAGRILILTGPNHGGKTTFLQGVGLVHLLAQVGCHVPGTDALVSPLDHLFTHFPLEEKPESEAGRFGEEAMRLGTIFEQVTRDSLVLLNESLSSTSFSESLYLAQDLMRILRRIGARAIYSTHLHELASQVDELNASVPGDGKIISVVASPVTVSGQKNGAGVSHSYKLEIRPPLGRSYAREIAARYGVSYEQLEEVLSRRGVL